METIAKREREKFVLEMKIKAKRVEERNRKIEVKEKPRMIDFVWALFIFRVACKSK